MCGAALNGLRGRLVGPQEMVFGAVPETGLRQRVSGILTLRWENGAKQQGVYGRRPVVGGLWRISKVFWGCHVACVFAAWGRFATSDGSAFARRIERRSNTGTLAVYTWLL